MAIASFLLADAGDVQSNLTTAQIKDAMARGSGTLWVEIDGTTIEDAAFLYDLGFHPLAIDDTVSSEMHPAKAVDYGDYLFVIFHGVHYTVDSDLVETTELNLFIGNNYVVSAHNNPLFSVNAVKELASSGRPLRQGPEFLAFTLLSAVVGNVMPSVDKMADIADGIDEAILTSPSKDILEVILKLKRSATRLHRITLPQREVMRQFSEGEFPRVAEAMRIYYRSLADRISRLEDRTQNLEDRCVNSLAMYHSSVANRQNETMKVLSIVAAIFLPLSLIAGIYGMNFQNMPELGWRWGYFMVIGVMGGIMLLVMGLAWAGSWVAWGRRRTKWVRPFAVEANRLVSKGVVERILRMGPRHSSSRSTGPMDVGGKSEP